MLSLCQQDRRYGRREFLRIGGLTLGGLSLANLLAASSQGAASSGKLLTGKSVIYLFMHGGPSQFETWDPKMSAPSGIRSETGEVATALPGVTFGGTFPKLAARARRLAAVRSFTTGDANHDIKPIVSKDSGGANLGSLFARVAGPNHAGTGMPSSAVLFPQSVDAGAQPGNNNFGKFASSGQLGAAYAPFVPGAGGDLQQDMKLALPIDRLDDRRRLLAGLDQVKWARDQGHFQGLDRIREQAFSTLLGGVASAFDLSAEDPAVVARYDTAPLVRAESISKKWNNHKNYADNARSLGKLLLLARRLCEAGCGFVTVTTNFVWDMHADVNNAPCEEGMSYMGPPLDHAVSAFLDDVESRGLANDILLVCSGEMGRTPRVNKGGGRDHWGNLAPLLLAGGGIQTGQVIGQSTRDGGEPHTEPVTMKNLMATILGTVLDPGELRVTRSVPTDVLDAAIGAPPIAGLR